VQLAKKERCGKVRVVKLYSMTVNKFCLENEVIKRGNYVIKWRVFTT
jgi:hypothetical protein